jgi:hypothetical protein
VHVARETALCVVVTLTLKRMEGEYALYENSWFLHGEWQERCPRDSFPEADWKPRLSNASTSLQLFKDGLEAPKGEWLSEWRLESSKETDPEGWRYGGSFSVFLDSGSPGMGSSTSTQNVFLERCVRRRRWVRRFGVPSEARQIPASAAAASAAAAVIAVGAVSGGALAALGGTSANAAALPPLPASPPPSNPFTGVGEASGGKGGAGPKVDSGEAILSVLSRIPERVDSAALQPSAVAADLEALNKASQVLHRSIGVVGKSPSPPPSLVTSLSRGSKEMARRLKALEGICKARGGAAGAGSEAKAWQRLTAECVSLTRIVGEESLRLEKVSSINGSKPPGKAATNSSGKQRQDLEGRQQQQQQQEQGLQLALEHRSEAEWTLLEAQEREKDILHIAHEVSEVHQMFKDVSTLVEEQGEGLQRLEASTEKAAEEAKKGVEQIKQARKLQKETPCAIA